MKFGTVEEYREVLRKDGYSDLCFDIEDQILTMCMKSYEQEDEVYFIHYEPHSDFFYHMRFEKKELQKMINLLK